MGEPPSKSGWLQTTEIMSRLPIIREGGLGARGFPAQSIVTAILLGETAVLLVYCTYTYRAFPSFCPLQSINPTVAGEL